MVVSAPWIGGVAWSPMLGRVMPLTTPVVIRLFSMPIGPSACLVVGATVFFGLASSTTPTGGAGITCVACHGITHINSPIGNAAYTIEV